MIKNIIFDFGDVFINLDKEATYRELARLGVTEISEDMMQHYYQYEMGLITTDDFVSYFHDKFSISKEDLIRSWNAILLDFPEHRLHFIKELAASKQYRLFLLSNTNDLHISWIQDNWGEELYTEFKNCFEQFYLSHEINLRKPNTDIFEFVLKENKLQASETFFIDDTKENTDAAQQLGIHVWNNCPKTEDVVDLLTKQAFK
ncbi:HAD-IA family hydrolase [Tenacibaculum tangerinum]|uniref:HAD-IA family hydrolase n=1 Tax=Tenacibaculum tangerinum TaxID=3038772 RepID=A0ABY8L3Z4_9FLAO|nr:HAD-IA family hydrolase [Tenacibaculum tangerinum]WGH76152.1 HAD-IA family hydrolase [Tenacibaculum tangerinum]